MADDSGDTQTVTFSTPLPHSLDAQIHVRLTTRAKCLMLFVTTTGVDEGDTLAPLGSFVYAMPDVRPSLRCVLYGHQTDSVQRFKPSEPLCTNIYVDESSLEFAGRLARLVVKRTQQPVYVSCSLSLDRMGLGGTVEEVLEAFRAVAAPLLPLLPQLQNGA